MGVGCFPTDWLWNGPLYLPGLRLYIFKAGPGLKEGQYSVSGALFYSFHQTVVIQALAKLHHVLASTECLRQWAVCWGTEVQGSLAVLTLSTQQYFPDGVCTLTLLQGHRTQARRCSHLSWPLGQQRTRLLMSFTLESLCRVAPQAGITQHCLHAPSCQRGTLSTPRSPPCPQCALVALLCASSLCFLSPHLCTFAQSAPSSWTVIPCRLAWKRPFSFNSRSFL